MEDNIRITFPDSEKVYLRGEIYPDVRVGMRRVSLTPTVSIEEGRRVTRQNPPVYVYDTSGPYSDPAVSIDLRKGLPRLREQWIRSREVEQLKEISSEYGRQRLATAVWTTCASSTSACLIGQRPAARCRRCTTPSRESLLPRWNTWPFVRT